MRKSRLNELTELQKGDSVLFEEAAVEITFNGASTATMDNDDVISDADFIIKHNNTETGVRIECINGLPGFREIPGFLLTLEFSDGYNQFCGIILTKS